MTAAIRLLVVSQPCFRAINRAVFREIAKLGPAVHIATTTFYQFGDRRIEAEVARTNDYEISFLTPVGAHFRLQRFRGLGAVARRFNPTHIYVDSDPGSVLVLQAALAAPKAWICATTAENLPPHSARAFVKAIRRGDFREVANVIAKAGLLFISRFVLDRVFTVSDDGTRVIEAAGFSATKIPLGYSPDIFFVQCEEKRAATRFRLGLVSPTIAYFGRQVFEKGIHVLLDALAQLKDRPWQLLLDRFAGESAYTQKLTEQIDRLGIRERIIFFESSHEDMPDYMNAADLVVLPSVSTPKWQEQYGRVIQEAMACGRIVVASDSGSIAETMDGNGHLVREGDPSALSEKLRELLMRDTFIDLAAAKSASRNRSVARQAEIVYQCLKRSSKSKTCA